jgi:hypothetical protein
MFRTMTRKYNFLELRLELNFDIVVPMEKWNRVNPKISVRNSVGQVAPSWNLGT